MIKSDKTTIELLIEMCEKIQNNQDDIKDKLNSLIKEKQSSKLDALKNANNESDLSEQSKSIGK